MPLHKRWAVFVKIDGGRRNGIFYIRAIRKFAGALKDICSTMSLYHCLQQKLDNFRIKIATYQYLRRGSDEWYVIGWNVLVNINDTLRQYQPSELGEKTGEGLCRLKAQNANVRIVEERLDGWRIRRATNPYSIHLTIVHCLNCSRSYERQQRRAFRIHAGLAKDLFGLSSSGASDWPDGNAFSFELRQPLNRFVRGIKEPKWVVVNSS